MVQVSTNTVAIAIGRTVSFNPLQRVSLTAHRYAPPDAI